MFFFCKLFFEEWREISGLHFYKIILERKILREFCIKIQRLFTSPLVNIFDCKDYRAVKGARLKISYCGFVGSNPTPCIKSLHFIVHHIHYKIIVCLERSYLMFSNLFFSAKSLSLESLLL